MNQKTKKNLYRIISAMMGLIIIVMAFSFDAIEVNAETNFSEFPLGYRTKLRELQKLHPNWTFVPFNTGLDWNTVVENEMWGNRSLVYVTCDDSWKSKDPGDYDASKGKYIGKSGNNWLRASRVAVEYNLDPTNYFDEYHIFAFEQLSYNPSIHNVNGVEAIIANSWMSHRPLEDQPNSGFNYSNFFIQAAMDSGVSPYHLASRVLQEQGRGNVELKINYNSLISGEYGVYNYYNIGAYGKNSAEIIANGRVYAENKGWYTRALGLSGGAKIIGGDWINRGQDTLYLEKFDVDNSDGGLYNHQYMQNLQAPMAESGSVYRAYEECGAIDSNFVFKIPVYKNMPGNNPPISVEKVTQFVTRLYNICLDRDPDAEGLDYWIEVLANRQSNGCKAAQGFVFSKEFKEKNYCNECYVKHLYRAFLGREYDIEGLNYWIGELESGKTREEIFNGFLMSVEFGNLCDDYGIDRGSAIPVPRYGTVPEKACSSCGTEDGITLFVGRLYNLCLDREAEPEGFEYYHTLLWNHTLCASEAARQFVFSEEFINKGYDNKTYVDYLYRIMLGREADESGELYWIEKMDSGVSKEAVFDSFVHSQEFQNICNKYGIRAFP